jgi:hypothetical protein
MVVVTQGQSRSSPVRACHSAVAASETASLGTLAQRRKRSSHCRHPHKLEISDELLRAKMRTCFHLLAIGWNILLELESEVFVTQRRKIKTKSSDFITNVDLKRCHVPQCSDKLLVSSPKKVVNQK